MTLRPPRCPPASSTTSRRTEVADTFEFFLGTWSIERRIMDHHSGLRGWFRGVAEQIALDSAPGQPKRSRYDEVGDLSFGSYEGTARRSLTFVGRDEATVSIEFADGRPFIECDLRTGLWRADHLCGEDRYQLSFAVLTCESFEEQWRVRGPATDYEAHTRFSRLTSSESAQ